MKASELRIGNLLLDDESNNIMVVSRIESQQYTDWNNGDKHSITCLKLDTSKEYYVGYFRPIPLTEEWLLKFGFETLSNGYFSKNINEKTYIAQTPNGFWLAIERADSDEDGEEEYATQLNVKFVHQLQNLYFALTGEELEMKSINTQK